jgi:hypothetical protein
MGRLISGILNWIGWKAATLFLILFVIVLGTWIKGELKGFDQLVQQRGGWEVMRDQAIAEKEEYQRAANEKIQNAQTLVRRLQDRVDRIQSNINHIKINFPIASLIPGTQPWIDLQKLEIERASVQSALDAAQQAAQKISSEINEKKRQLDERIKVATDHVDAIDEKILQGYPGQIKAVIERDLPIALGVLAGIILTPIGIKMFFFYLVAPWASGRRSISILPLTSGQITVGPQKNNGVEVDGPHSETSQSIVLAEHEEVIVRPEFLGPMSLRSRKSTKCLLNNSYPFASVLSGMYLLTKVSRSGSDPVVLSAKNDPLQEVGILNLPEGAAFVCQPRSLIGVIQDRRNPIRITRHWRLGHLQSWLTLQLRFLAFHGPGQLVLAGCRGIRLESTGTGRLINQAATIGFSANIEYSNIRTETFYPYLKDEQGLFDDIFTGTSGVYVYEEVPNHGRQGGIAGRGMEGVLDSLLKVFGV